MDIRKWISDGDPRREAIDGLKMHAKPDLTIINFGSDEVDIFRVAEFMANWCPA